MKEVKITLNVVRRGAFQGDEVMLLTTTPQSSLDEYLVSKLGRGLDLFRYVHDRVVSNRGVYEGYLADTLDPDLIVLITTARIEPVHPKQIISVKTNSKYTHRRGLDEPYNRG